MLKITVPSKEYWDEQTEEFKYFRETTLQLEHSLVSVSKWEAEHEKSFFVKEELSDAELLDYIRCMTITQNVNPEVYLRLTRENISQVIDYMTRPMTATKFSGNRFSQRGRQFVTSELIYYWMAALGIPIECQKWHLNRLITLIRIANEENKPKKKQSAKSLTKSYAALNAARRKKYGTKG